MTDILRLMLMLVLLTAGLATYFLVLGAFFPARVARTISVLQTMPGRSFGIGLVNFAFFAVLVIVLFSLADRAGPFLKGLLTLPALVISAVLIIFLTFGFTATTSVLGERIFPGLPAWKQSLWGTVCLSFASAVPFAGWLLLLPYAGCLGMGAFILGLFQREPKV